MSQKNPVTTHPKYSGTLFYAPAIKQLIMEQHLTTESANAGLQPKTDSGYQYNKPETSIGITAPEKETPGKPDEKPEKRHPETEKPEVHEMPATKDNPEVEKTDIDEVPNTEIEELPDTEPIEIPDTNITEMPDQQTG